MDFVCSLGKKRRLTFMECNNDINTMIDLAKVADLVSVLFRANGCNNTGHVSWYKGISQLQRG